MKVNVHPVATRSKASLPYRLILLTGTMGGGKSTVADLLRKKPGVAIVNADEVAKAVIYKREHYPKLLKILGNGVFVGGSISFPKVAEVIFRDQEKRSVLERFATLPIKLAMLSEIKKASARKGVRLIIIENAIGLEKSWQEIYPFDTIVCIYCNKAEQLRRLAATRGYSEEEVRNRTKSHMPLAEKLKLSDMSICTEGTRAELSLATDALYAHLMTPWVRALPV